MIILHAALVEQDFCVWAETSAVSSPAPRRRRGRVAAAGGAPDFLFDGGADSLETTLKERFPQLSIHKNKAAKLAAWLPTAGGQPIASNPIIAQPPAPDAAPALAPWMVTAFRLSPVAAVELLGACLDQETLGPGVIVGKDLAFWAKALRFAGALVTRQQFLPSLAKIRGQYHARWEAAFLAADAERLATLAKAMPHASRALSEAADAPPETAAASVLTAFLHQVTDHLVRSARGIDGKFPAPLQRRTHKTDFDSIHDQWLHALRAPDGVMSGTEAELAALAEQVREWHRTIAVTAAAPVRLCFRLEEPPAQEPESESGIRTGPEPAPAAGQESRGASPALPSALAGRMSAQPSAPWRVEFLLQAVDDPSLLVPAQEAWKPRSDKAAVLQRRGFNVREYLLSALGQASGICPRIERSLRTKTPGGYALDTGGAFEFLSQTASGLEQAGFGVLLPAWWTGKGTKLRLSARAQVKSPKMQGGSGMSLEEIVHFDWQIALGDTTLTWAELELLAKLKTPLVKIRGQWVQLTAEEIQAALELWKKKGAGQGRVRDLIQMALGAKPAVTGVEFEGVQASGWIADLLAQLETHAGFEEWPAPSGFRGTLREYQGRGYSWLGFLQRWGLGACLADDMGLGKTIQVLALVQREWESTRRPGPVLLIAPTSVVGNWHKEAARFTPELPVLVHHGTERTRGAAFGELAARQAIVISSYALLHRDFELFKTVPWSAVVLDEAQNVKNPETKQSKAARNLQAPTRIALTGTPVENNVGDLWSIMEFLNPGFLGSQAEFKRRFFLPIQVDRNPQATERLKRLTGPFILRRVKTDKNVIADLPDKLEMKVFCPLTKEQASLYAAVVREAGEALEETDRRDEANSIQRRGVVLATLMKLKQVCNHPVQFLGDNSAIPGRSGKLARLTEMLEEILAVGERALVFSQFSEMGELLRRHLQETFGREVFFLHGGVPKKQRDQMVERFQGDDNPPQIFLLSLKAGGTGLNLTRANHVFHFDRWWNPAVENQATDRAFRIGQTRNVQVHKFLCQGTLEEKIDEMIERKKEVATQVVGAGEGWLTELSTADLKELFALRAEAIQE